jgi:hypothetical protein
MQRPEMFSYFNGLASFPRENATTLSRRDCFRVVTERAPPLSGNAGPNDEIPLGFQLQAFAVVPSEAKSP